MIHIKRIAILIGAVVLGFTFSSTALAGYGGSKYSRSSSYTYDAGYRYRKRYYTPRYRHYKRAYRSSYHRPYKRYRRYTSRYYRGYYQRRAYSGYGYGHGRRYYKSKSCWLCFNFSLGLSIGGGSGYGGYGGY